MLLGEPLQTSMNIVSTFTRRIDKNQFEIKQTNKHKKNQYQRR